MQAGSYENSSFTPFRGAPDLGKGERTVIRGVPSDLLISCAVFNIFLSFQVYVAPSVGTEQSRLRTTLEGSSCSLAWSSLDFWHITGISQLRGHSLSCPPIAYGFVWLFWAAVPISLRIISAGMRSSTEQDSRGFALLTS